MLRDTIDKYVKLFKEVSDVRASLKLFDDMKKEFEISSPLVEEILQELEEYASNPNYSGASLLICAIWSNLSLNYTPILCQILSDESNNKLHEPIVEILGELADERAIPALHKALTYRWLYDEWLDVPRKSLLALAEIDTPKSIAIVKEATQSSEKLIRREANTIIEVLCPKTDNPEVGAE